MKVQGVSHLALSTRDMKKSLHFYCDILGFRVLSDKASHPSIDHDSDGEKLTYRVGRLVHLSWGSGPYVPFITMQQHVEPLGERAVPLNHIGLHHIGLWVEDFDATVDRLKAAGVPFVFQPATTDGGAYPGSDGRVKSFMCRDPDGTVIQIDHRLE